MSGEIYHYCMVRFGGRKLYAYLTNGLPVQIGSRVWVPCGKAHQEREGVVFSVMDCTREMAPWPPEKTKAVLRIAPSPTEPVEPVCPKAEDAQPLQEHSTTTSEEQSAVPSPESPPEEPHAEPIPPLPEDPLPPKKKPAAESNPAGKKPLQKLTFGVLAALLCAVIVGFVYWMVDSHYRKAETYLAVNELASAESELASVPRFYKDAKEITAYLNLCKLAESGTEADYKTALDGMAAILAESGEPLKSTVQNKYDSLNASYRDLLYQTGCGLLEKGQYPAAQNYFWQIPDYPYVSELLCYTQASMARTDNSSTYLKRMLQSLGQIPTDYAGPFAEEISALRIKLADMIVEAEGRERKAEEDRKAAEEARQAAEKKAEEERRASGIPYVGMAEREINSTRQLGKAGYAGTDSDYVKGSDGKYFRDTWQVYAWYNTDGNIVFKACCRDGVVTSVEKYLKDSCWSGDKLLVKLGPFKPQTFHYGGGSSKDDGAGGGHSLRDDYDSPEDLFEDGDYDDLDEAWDEWEEGW